MNQPNLKNEKNQRQKIYISEVIKILKKFRGKKYIYIRGNKKFEKKIRGKIFSMTRVHT